MDQYSNYCTEFLNLTDAVTRALIRETRRFLSSTSQVPGRSDWTDVTADSIVMYLAEERVDLSTASLGITVTAIRRFFRFLKQNERSIHTSILQLPLSVPNWNRNGSLPVLLTQEQLLKLTSTEFDNTLTGLRDRAILLSFTELGLRCREVARLNYEDVKWHNGTVLIRKTKTCAQRELPLSEKLGEALKEYRNDRSAFFSHEFCCIFLNLGLAILECIVSNPVDPTPVFLSHSACLPVIDLASSFLQ